MSLSSKLSKLWRITVTEKHDPFIVYADDHESAYDKAMQVPWRSDNTSPDIKVEQVTSEEELDNCF